MSTANRHAWRELLAKVALIGWEFKSFDGNGHLRLFHPATGEHYSMAATPSDWRGERNCIADLERISGRKIPRPKAGKLTHRRQTQMSTRLSDAEQQASGTVGLLAAEADDIRHEFQRLAAQLPVTNAAATQGRKCFERYGVLQAQLKSFHRVIPQITEICAKNCSHPSHRVGADDNERKFDV